jgi:branched-chain amino acid transport system permease protein/urea transport system permease protein
VDQVLVQTLNGLSLAGILALVALGLGITFGLLGVINLAHGELFMLGAYTVVFTYNATRHLWLGMAVAPLVVGLLGFAIERVVIKRLYARLFDTLLATWALSILARQGVQLWTQGRFEGLPSPVHGSAHVLGVDYPLYRLFLLGVGAAVLAGAWGLLYRTRLGIRARAAIQNREIASAMGVDVAMTDSLTFALGAALAGLAGAFMSPLITINPSMGLPFLASSFFVVILGGAGSLLGVLVGSIIVGGAQAVASFFINPVAAQLIVLGLSIVTLRVAPRGVLGK